MIEIWQPVIGYEGIYEVSNFGRVKSFKYGRETLRKPFLRKDGYFELGLCKNGKKKNFLVHRIELEAFQGLSGDPAQIFVNHKDGVKSNNILSNLEWSTPGENTRHAWKSGLSENVRLAAKKQTNNAKINYNDATEIREIYAQGGFTQQEIADIYSLDQTTISEIILFKIWKDQIEV